MASRNKRNKWDEDAGRKTNVSGIRDWADKNTGKNRNKNSDAMRKSETRGVSEWARNYRKVRDEEEEREAVYDPGRRHQKESDKYRMGRNSVVDERSTRNRFHDDAGNPTDASDFSSWHQKQQRAAEDAEAKSRAIQRNYEGMKRDKVSQLLGAVDKKRKEQEQQAAAAQQGRFGDKLQSMGGRLLDEVNRKRQEQAQQAAAAQQQRYDSAMQDKAGQLLYADQKRKQLEASAAAKAQENRYAGMKQTRVDQLLGGIGIANRKKAEAAQAEAQAQQARTDRGYGSAMGSRADQLLGMVEKKRKDEEEILRSAQNDEAQQQKVAQAGRYANYKQSKVDQLLGAVAQKKQENNYKRRAAGIETGKNREEENGSNYTRFFDGDIVKEVVIPNSINGKKVSDEEAIDYYFEKGDYLGTFDKIEDAEKYIDELNRNHNTRQADASGFTDYVKKEMGIGQKEEEDIRTPWNVKDARNSAAAQSGTKYSVPMADRQTVLQRAEEQQQKVMDAYNRKEIAAFFEKENPDLAFTYDEKTRNIGIQFWTEELQKAQEAKAGRINEYNEANTEFWSEYKNSPAFQYAYIIDEINEQAVEKGRVSAEHQVKWEDEISRIAESMTGEDKAIGEELLEMVRSGDYEGAVDRYYEIEDENKPYDRSSEYDERISQAKYWLNQLENAEENGKIALMYGNYAEYTAEELDEAEKLLQEKYKEIEAGQPKLGSEPGSVEELNAILEELDTIWVPMDPVTGKTLNGYNYTIDSMQDIQSRLKQITKAREQLQEVKRYEGIKVDHPDYTYHPEDISWGNISNKLAAEFTGILDGANAQEVYVYLNEGTREYPMTNTIALITGRDPIDAHKTKPSYMTDEQKNKFNELYNAGLHDEAFAYYQALSHYLNAKIGKEKEEEAKLAANGPQGAIWGQQQVFSDVAMAPIRFLAGGAAAFGDKESADPNSWAWQGMQRSETIKGERIRKMGDATEKSGLGRDVGETIASAGYSLENQLLIYAGAGAMGGVETASRAMTLLPFMFQSGAQDTYKALKEYKDPVEAFIRGTISGMIEGATETWVTLDNVFLSEMGESWWKTIAKGTISEIGEELTSNMAERVMDNIGSMITKDLPEIHQNALAYARQLAIQNGTTEEEEYQNGVRMAEQDWTNENINTIIETAMTTLGLFGGRAVGNQFYNNSVGKNIRTNDTGNENLNYLQKIGLSMPKESKSYRAAAAMNEKRGGIEKASNRQIGQLVQNIMAEGGESIQKETQETAKEIIAERLQGMGVEELQAQKEADIVVKAAMNGVEALNRSERKALDESIPAFDVYMAMVSPEQMADTEAAAQAKETADMVNMGVGLTTGQQRANMRTVAQIAEGENVNELIGRDHTHVDLKAVQEQLASEEVITTAQAQEVFREKTLAAVAAGEAAEIEGIRDGKAEIRKADGTTGTVELADIKAGNRQVAELVTFLRTHKGVMSDDVATKALAAIGAEGEKASGRFAQDAAAISFAAWERKQSMPRTSLQPEVAEELWKTAQADVQKANAARIRPETRAQEGKGTASFDGAAYGTKEWTRKLKETVDDDTRRKANATAEVARILGQKVNFIYDNSENGKLTNGDFNQETGEITINLAAQRLVWDPESGKEVEKGTVNPLATISHEMTHGLQTTSADGFERLTRFVVDEMEASGVDMEQKILDTMDSYNKFYQDNDIRDESGEIRQMTAEDAMYEIVANSCEGILTSEEFAKRMQKADAGLYGKVKDYVQRMVARIRTALQDIRGSLHGEAQMIRDVDEMARIWLGAYDEVIHGAVVEAQQQEAQQAELMQQEEAAVEQLETEEDKSEIERLLKQVNPYGEINPEWSVQEQKDEQQEKKKKIRDLFKRNYSIQDSAYMNAVEHKDTDEAQWMVNEKAEESGYTDTVFHGSQSFGYTEFDMDDSQNSIFVSYDPELAGTYTKNGKVREVKDNKGYVDYASMDNSELADALQEFKDFDKGPFVGFESVEGTEDGGFRFTWDDGTTTKESRRSVIHGLQWMNNEKNNTEGIYELFANPGNQLVVDAQFSNWNKIYFEPLYIESYSSSFMDEGKSAFTTRDIAAWARWHGYDSVRINNVSDDGGRSSRPRRNTGDIGIFFNPEAVKSADTVVYDDQGNVIPLSERFNKKNKDIRYSIQVKDTEENRKYLNAVERGDTAEQQRMVDEAAKKAGYEELKYHGTLSDFNSFDASKSTFGGSGLGFYFGNERVAESYSNYRTAKNKGRLIKAYIDTSNFATDNDHRITASMVEEAMKKLKLTPEETYLAWPSAYGNSAEDFVQRRGDREIMYMLEKWGWYGGVQEKYNSQSNGLKPIFSEQEILDILMDTFKYKGIKNDFETVVWDNKLIKSADPVTYDDQGNVIPLSERFNKENKDIRYSIQDRPEMDIRMWLEGVPESSLTTEAERMLIRQYKGLAKAIEVNQENQRSLKRRISFMEERQNKLTPKEKSLLKGLKIRLENAASAEKANQAKMDKFVSQEGFARIMRERQEMLNNFVTGKNQEEVNAAVEKMQQASDKLQADIDRTREELKALADSHVIREVRSRIGNRTLDSAATRIRKNYNSTINKTELMNSLAKISLMIENAADAEEIEAEIETLAGQIIENRKSSERNQSLEMLKGITLRLSKSQIRELTGSDSGIKELRRMMAGSGVKVVDLEAANRRSAVTDAAGNTVKGNAASLDASWDELKSFVPALDGYGGIDTDNALNQPRAVAEFVMNAMAEQRESGKREFEGRMAEVIADLSQEISGIKMNLPSDPATLRRILGDMEKYVTEIAGKASKAARQMYETQLQAERMMGQGRTAAAWSRNMKNDIAQTIEYFNKTAQLAVNNEKRVRQDEIIRQLKDQYTQKLVKANTEWREMMDRDREARLQMEDNTAARKRMTTVLTRLGKLLSSPTATKNIPEHMNSLARELLERFVNSDLSEGRRKITLGSKKGLAEMSRKLEAWKQRDGGYTETEIADEIIRDLVNDRLDQLSEAIKEWNGTFRGKNALDTVQQMGKTLEKMENALHDIYQVIQREREITLGDRRVAVEDQAEYVRYQTHGKIAKEWTGDIGQKLSLLHKAIVSGNMTPEYFFRMLGNDGLSELWEEYHRAENNNGLELRKAQQKIGELAKKYGYDQWDTDKKYHIELEKGGDVDLTLGQIMSLWATWNREATLGPEMSEHLTKGGFYAEQDVKAGILGKTEAKKKAHRMTEGDYEKISDILTQEQKDFINDVVGFMSNDMSKLGNAASMAAYGIKMYKEKYYYPFKMWDGIKNRKSNDSGNAANANMIWHPSFSKSRMHGANNALIIGDFMETAADHIIGMINYATMGLANDTMQKVLNYKATEGTNSDDMTKRNIRTILEEAYGKEAMEYLTNLQAQLNGGAVATQKTIGDKLISLFRKNAVAGSLSVALQQPLSYLRAALVIDPKYLAGALVKDFKGSYEELLQHSGVAVIKNMGRFDMGMGQSAREYLMPDSKQSVGRKIWEQVKDKSTFLPEVMDNATWTRIWVAVKSEQHDLHPEMDVKSDEFLDMCGERFNDIIRRTQVYDSTLVKSQNMRSDNYLIKGITSFMGEPTVTLNILADTARQVKNGEKGAVGRMAGASAVYIMSAIMQAAFKGNMGAGRSPDEKKTFLENFLYKFGYNFINEINPISQIPGYSELIEELKKGEVTDDALGIIGKMRTAGTTGLEMLLGKKPLEYRNWEDSVGQIVQLFSGVPVKNIMRDARAIYNFATQPYADRPSSAAVIKYQALDQLHSADNLIGALNKYLTDNKYGGYQTNNAGYYQRIYNAKKAGNDQKSKEMTEYMTKGKGVKEETVNENIRGLINKDDSLSNMEAAELYKEYGGNANSYIKQAAESGEISTAEAVDKLDMKDPSDYIKDQLKAGQIDAAEARKLLKKQEPEKDDDSIWWTVDRIEYKKETGKDAGSSTYYRLWDAMESNTASDINKAIDTMIKHGMKKENIKKEAAKHWKADYLKADSKGKVRIKDAIHKAYKALGYTTEDADKIINGWK